MSAMSSAAGNLASPTRESKRQGGGRGSGKDEDLKQKQPDSKLGALKIHNALEANLKRYRTFEREQGDLLGMLVRKAEAKVKSGSQTADLLQALQMEIKYRRRLKEQSLNLIQQILSHNRDHVLNLNKQKEAIISSAATARQAMDHSHHRQEVNTRSDGLGKLGEEELDVYDWVIDINLLADLADEGWKVYYSKRVDKEDRKARDWPGAVVAVVGLYDKGKTFVLNCLTAANLPSGKKVRTLGLSFKHMDVDGTSFTLLDSAGSNAPVRVENSLSVYQKEATEHFILDVIFEVADYFVCVVNDFTSLDQRYLDKLARSLQSSDKNFREIIVVHNFKDVTSLDVLEHLWDTQVREIYRSGGGQSIRTNVAAKNTKTGVLEDRTVTWFKTRYSRHICLAHENSQLGESVNPWAISLLRYWLKSVVVPPQRRLSVSEEVVGLCSKKLSVCFREMTTPTLLKVFPSPDPNVGFIRPSDPEHKKRFRLPRITLDGSSVVLARPDSFTPPVDIVKHSSRFIVQMDAPGLKASDIVLSRENATTLIRGKRRPISLVTEVTKGDAGGTDGAKKAEKQERKYGNFSVSVEVPMAYRSRWSKCFLKDGVLSIEYQTDTDELNVTPEVGNGTGNGTGNGNGNGNGPGNGNGNGPGNGPGFGS